jgi:hypothetical protein
MLSFNAEHGGMRMGVKSVWRKRSGTKSRNKENKYFLNYLKPSISLEC